MAVTGIGGSFRWVCAQVRGYGRRTAETSSRTSTRLSTSSPPPSTALFHVSPKSRPVEHARDIEADALGPRVIAAGAEDLAGQLDASGHAADSEVADDSDLFFAEPLDRRRREGDQGMLVDVEEVGGAQVVVARGHARVQRGGVDGARRRRRAVLADRQRAVEAVKDPAHACQTDVLDAELDRRVIGVDDPRARSDATWTKRSW
jgi:hypothetical protein